MLGLNSRKYRLTVFVMVLITVMAIASNWLANLRELFPTFGSLILGALTAYISGNVVQKKLIAVSQNGAEEAEDALGKVEPPPGFGE